MAIDLEEIANTGERIHVLRGISKKPEDHPEALRDYAYNYLPSEGVGEDEQNAVEQLLLKDPIALREAIFQKRAKQTQKLIDGVAESPRTIIEELDERKVVSIAWGLFGDKKYRELAGYIQNRDYGSVAGALNDIFTDIQLEISLASPEVVMNVAQMYVAKNQTKFAVENLSKTQGTRDKKEAVYDDTKAADYLATKINELDEREKPRIFELIGLAYSDKKQKKDVENNTDQDKGR